MTINCPSCDASYRVDPATIGAGRRVRCSRCRAEWVAGGVVPAADAREDDPAPILGLEDAAPVEAIDQEPGAAPETLDAEVYPTRAVAQPKRRGSLWPGRAPRPSASTIGRPGRPKRRSWSLRPSAVAASLALICFGALIGGRVEAVRAAPSLASLYAAVGLPVNVRGLAIDGVKSVEEIEDGVPILLVVGEVRNISGAGVDVPRLRLAVTGRGESELYSWTTVATRPKLSPGEHATFRARLASPPADGRGVAVRFLARQDLAVRAAR